MIRRGEVYWVDLDPSAGAGTRKTRPVLVVSNDLNNMHAATLTVLPIASGAEKVYPFEVLLKPGLCGNKEACKARADQVRTVARRRLGKLMGTVPLEVMERVDRALLLHLGLRGLVI